MATPRPPRYRGPMPGSAPPSRKGPPKPVHITVGSDGQVQATVDGEAVDVRDLLASILPAAKPPGPNGPESDDAK